MEQGVLKCLLDFARAFASQDWKVIEMSLCEVIFIDDNGHRGGDGTWMSREHYLSHLKKEFLDTHVSYQLSDLGIKMVGNQATCRSLFFLNRSAIGEETSLHSYGRSTFHLTNAEQGWQIEKIIRFFEGSQGD